MITIYGSEMCPNCIECKRNFDFYKIPYKYIDINQSLKNLKDFLVYRDNLPIYDECKRNHRIGIPTLVKDNGEAFLTWESYLKDQGYKVLDLNDEEKSSCSLKNKNC